MPTRHYWAQVDCSPSMMFEISSLSAFKDKINQISASDAGLLKLKEGLWSKCSRKKCYFDVLLRGSFSRTNCEGG